MGTEARSIPAYRQKQRWKRLFRRTNMEGNNTKRKFLILLFLTVLLLLVAAIAPYLAPLDPYAQDLNHALEPPGKEYFLGTDRYGRDLFSRVIAGAQISIYSALFLVVMITVIGTAIGVFSGYCGGKIDGLLMRISEIFLAFPGLVFAIAAAAVLGGGTWNSVLALAVISWPKYARIARSQVLSIKNAVFIEAVKLSGSSTWNIIRKHILPNIVGPILVTAVLDIGTMMMELAGLSFLGLGAKPPAAEWGSMMSNGRSMLQTAPWVILGPGAAIFLSVALFNLLGDTVRDLLDPEQKAAYVEGDIE